MRLFDFAFCHDYEKKIQNLSGLCPEKWSFGGQSDNVILKNYIEHMMGIVNLPKRANYFDDPSALVFDTNCDIFPQYPHIFGDAENFLRICVELLRFELTLFLIDYAFIIEIGKVSSF